MILFSFMTNVMVYHLFVLAFIIGAQFYQSFFANITAARALTRAQFRVLQAAIWPMYFKLQMITALGLMLTYPGNDPKSFGARLSPTYEQLSLFGVFKHGNRLAVMTPLLFMFAFAATNVFYVAPTAISSMWKAQLEAARHEKNTEGKATTSSSDVDTLHRKFMAYHGASYGCAMGALVASVVYAVSLAGRTL